MMLFCSRLTTPSMASSTKVILLERWEAVVGERGHVALPGLELLAHVLRPFHALDRRRREGDEAADRDQAFANLRTQVALAADRDQDLRVTPGVAAALAAGLEDVVGDGVDVGADALQEQSISDDGNLTGHRYLWQVGGCKAARIRRSGQICSRIGRNRHTLRQKRHRLGLAVRDGSLSSGSVAGLDDNKA